MQFQAFDKVFRVANTRVVCVTIQNPARDGDFICGQTSCLTDTCVSLKHGLSEPIWLRRSTPISSSSHCHSYRIYMQPQFKVQPTQLAKDWSANPCSIFVIISVTGWKLINVITQIISCHLKANMSCYIAYLTNECAIIDLIVSTLNPRDPINFNKTVIAFSVIIIETFLLRLSFYRAHKDEDLHLISPTACNFSRPSQCKRQPPCVLPSVSPQVGVPSEGARQRTLTDHSESEVVLIYLRGRCKWVAALAPA